jgi:hypothetical protein
MQAQQEQCRFCERFFSVEQIRQGTPVPTFRGQHYRLVLIDEVVHKFQPVLKKNKFIGEAR